MQGGVKEDYAIEDYYALEHSGISMEKTQLGTNTQLLFIDFLWSARAMLNILPSKTLALKLDFLSTLLSIH